MGIFYKIRKSGSHWKKGTAFWSETCFTSFQTLYIQEALVLELGCVYILGSFHWRKGINFSHYETFTNMILRLWLWNISNKFWSMVNNLVDHHSIILVQLLIILSLKSVLWYELYHEASITICIVLWEECIVAALVTRYTSATFQTFE